MFSFLYVSVCLGEDVPSEIFFHLMCSLSPMHYMFKRFFLCIYLFSSVQDGAVAICDAVGWNLTLKSLDLGWNAFGSSGKLPYGSTVTDSGSGGINTTADSSRQSMQKSSTKEPPTKDDGLPFAHVESLIQPALVFLARSMETNVTLTSLNLAHNQIDSDSALAFSFALMRNSPLSGVWGIKSTPPTLRFLDMR